MAFSIFASGTVVDADEINANFYWGFKANTATVTRYPMTGTSLETGTSNTHDIGASTTAWKDVYCDTLNVGNTVSSGQNLWSLLAETTLDDTVTSIDVVNLQGNTRKEYLFEFFLVAAATGTLSVRLNLDNGTSYGWQYLESYNTLATAAIRDTGTSIPVAWKCIYGTTGAIYSHVVFSLYANAGMERVLIGRTSHSFEAGYVYGQAEWVGVWSNSTDELTTLSFLYSVADSIRTNTVLKIWGRT